MNDFKLTGDDVMGRKKKDKIFVEGLKSNFLFIIFPVIVVLKVVYLIFKG